MLLIGLMGQAGAGKDSVADIIEAEVDCVRFAFGDFLKAEVADAFGVDVRLFHDRASKEQPRPELALHRCASTDFRYSAAGTELEAAATPRAVMQAWGDMRRGQDPSYFLHAAAVARAVARNSGAEVMVATDVRFRNEADWVSSHDGVLWRIDRRDLEPVREHHSEQQYRAIPYDLHIWNNGTLDELRRIVVDLVRVALEEHRRAA